MKHLHTFVKNTIPEDVYKILVALCHKYPDLYFRYFNGEIFYCDVRYKERLLKSPLHFTTLTERNWPEYVRIYEHNYRGAEIDPERVFLE